MKKENGLLKWIGLFLVGLGALFTLMGCYFVWYAHMAAWVETQAKVNGVTVRVSIHTAGDALRRDNTYYPEISYDYVVDGEMYSSNKYELLSDHKHFNTRSEALKVAVRYRNGDAITAYYNDKQPSVAVLKPGVHLSDYIALLIGLLFGVTGLLLYRFRFTAIEGEKHSESVL